MYLPDGGSDKGYIEPELDDCDSHCRRRAVNGNVTGRFFRYLLGAAMLVLLFRAPASWADENALSIIQENCQACHNPQKHKGGLTLTSRESALKGGEDGVVIQPGKSAASKLMELIAPGSDPHMPPKGQLTADEIEALKKWIDGGAVWPADVVMTPTT